MVSVARAVFSARKPWDWMFFFNPLTDRAQWREQGHSSHQLCKAHSCFPACFHTDFSISLLNVTFPWGFIGWPGHRDWWLLPAEFTVG